MRIAICQLNTVWKDKKANFDKFEKLLADNDTGEIDLWVLPEMSFTGFSMDISDTAEDDCLTVEHIKKLAWKYSVNIGFGWTKRCGEKAKNIYTIVSAQGEILSDYAKIHPFSFANEDKYFEAGDTIPLFSICDIPFSNVICYDLRFPELFQIESVDAHMILVPANWPASRSEHWKTLLRARAIENQVYIIASNCVGDINGLTYSGDSCVVNPLGEVLTMLSNEEGLLIIDVEDDALQYRNAFPQKKDRRNAFYAGLLK